MSRRLAAAAALLLTTSAFAGNEGWGRVTASAGWRYTPNVHFFNVGEQLGYARGSYYGGPVLTGSFAYAATDLIEISIDLFGTGEQLHLSSTPYTTLTYGGWLGGRLTFEWPRFGPFDRMIPFIGVGGGPTVVIATGGPQGVYQEVGGQAYTATLGLTGYKGESGVTLEARYVIARGTASPIGTFEGGGAWVVLGYTWGFPPSGPSRSAAGL